MSSRQMMRLLTESPDRALLPGEARCPGPSVQDTLASEDSRSDPFLTTTQYEYLGSEDLSLSRYTDPTMHELEMKRLWPRVWQWACREEHIPEPGDYQVYDVGPYSALIVRDADRQIRAFVNSCPHRGMQFAGAGESGSGKQFIRCPFHGMSWHLDGSLREIPCRWDFPHVEDSEFGLIELPVGLWAGFVFVNFDRNCAPLEAQLEVLPEHFRNWGLEDRFVAVHTEKELPGNWKMCMEAFLEAYHVLATHPEGLAGSAWANTQYDVFGRYVTRFLQTLSTGNPLTEQTEAEIYEALGHPPGSLPEGARARTRHAEELRRSLGEAYGCDLSDVCTSLMLDSIEYHLFPNACFFPGIQIPLIYRFRPKGYDRCVHEILILQPLPDSGERPPPAPVIRLGIDDSYTNVEGFWLARVLDQDTDNFHRQWAGLNASLKGTQTLGNYQEVRIRRFHKTLDEYLFGAAAAQASVRS